VLLMPRGTCLVDDSIRLMVGTAGSSWHMYISICLYIVCYINGILLQSAADNGQQTVAGNPTTHNILSQKWYLYTFVKCSIVEKVWIKLDLHTLYHHVHKHKSILIECLVGDFMQCEFKTYYTINLSLVHLHATQNHLVILIHQSMCN